jgi:hypothetical protein
VDGSIFAYHFGTYFVLGLKDFIFGDASVWLAQQMMVELFQSSKQNISRPIKSILMKANFSHGQ